jgi:hypothetical protein
MSEASNKVEMEAESFVAHAAHRWAHAVARVIDCPFDLRTVAMWGRAIGVSEGTIRDWCRAANCLPKRSLDFARLLRAIVQSQERDWDPFNLLDVVNERTMRNLLKRGGLPDLLSAPVPPTPRGFVVKQRFVTNSRALEAVTASIETAHNGIRRISRERGSRLQESLGN